MAGYSGIECLAETGSYKGKYCGNTGVATRKYKGSFKWLCHTHVKQFDEKRLK